MKIMSHVPRDLVVAIAVFLLLLATAAYFNIPTPQSEDIGFGWEYGNIAEALVRGKGFANPFGYDSGPTAWMPPFYVFLLAGIFYLFGIKSIAATWAILLIKYIAITACFYLLFQAVNYSGYPKYKYVLVPIFLVLIFINRGAYFKTVRDEWLILFLSCSMVVVFMKRIYKPSRFNTICQWLLAFVLPLANPALALSFAVVEAGFFFWHKPESSSARSRLLSTLVVCGFLAASTFLWTYRNYQQFGIFIPIKSNFWFEFYQANVLDEDGLITRTTFNKYHPIQKNEIQEKYLIEKEVQFNREARDLSLKWMRTDPLRLWQNIGRRAISAFLYMHEVEDIQPVKPGLLSSEDAQKLAHENLISSQEDHVVYWISLPMSPEEFEQQIHPLKLSDEASIFQDWSARRTTLINRKNDPRIIIRSFSVSFIPIFCLICGLVVKKIRKDPLFIIAATIYFTYLIPYLLVSYYRRYQVPLIGLHSIFIFFFICILLERFLPLGLPFLNSDGAKAKK